MRRRTLVAALPLACTARLAGAGLFDPDVQDVEVGSSSNSVLDPKTSSRLVVRSRLRTREIRWIDAQGRVRDTSSQTLVDNKYDWQDSVQRATDIWRITAEDLEEPGMMVLRVRSPQGFPLVVTLFPGVVSASRLDPDVGIEVRPSEEASHEWLALFRLDPRQKNFVTVQAQQAERVPYRITVLPAARFRR